MEKKEHFPEIQNYLFDNCDTLEIYMPYYKHNKINYKHNLSFIKSYIKSLLKFIKGLH